MLPQMTFFHPTPASLRRRKEMSGLISEERFNSLEKRVAALEQATQNVPRWVIGLIGFFVGCVGTYIGEAVSRLIR